MGSFTTQAPVFVQMPGDGGLGGPVYLFMGLTSSTRLSKACRKGVVVEAVEEVLGCCQPCEV